MANRGWVDNGGSVGSASPGTFPDYDVEAKDAGEPWPMQPPTFGTMTSRSLARDLNGFPQSPSLPCGAEDDHYICTLPKKHSGPHKAHGADKGNPLHEWRTSSDPINHPPHYTFGKIEVIDVIEDWGLSFHLAQVVKYVARSKHKGKELEDLRKARFYLNRLITSLEK